MPKGLKGFQKGHTINLGKKYSDERKENISNALKGRKVSDEWRENLSKSHMGIRQSEETKRKISKSMKGVSTKWLTGRKLSEEAKAKISEAHKLEKHWNWKADDAGYSPKHKWIKQIKGSPNECEHCGKTGNNRQIHWSNKDHKYRRNVDDWLRLCVKCHWAYDKEFNGK